MLFSTIFLFFDVPQYSNRVDYINDIRPAIYFNIQNNHCISSLTMACATEFWVNRRRSWFIWYFTNL